MNEEIEPPINDEVERRAAPEAPIHITLKDVAIRAGVTPPVVSRVLHNRSSSVRVSDATAERVRDAAKELGYRVNVFARNFREQKTHTIAVLNGQGLERPRFNLGPRYFASLMDGIVDGAFSRGYSVTLCPLLLTGSPEDAINDGRFDGLIWYSISPTPETLRALDQCVVPLVIVHAYAKDYDDRYPTVICDNHQGVGLAVNYLVDNGHTRIAFAIEGDALNVESIERFDAYKDWMSKRGLPVTESDVLDVRRDRANLHHYLANPRPHTAVIVHADGLASEFIQVAPSHGVQIPEDLSVVGFDSTEFCDTFRPTLTSIAQPLVELGWNSAEMLLDSIAGKMPNPVERIIPCRLDLRGSTMSLLSAKESLAEPARVRSLRTGP